MIVYELPKEIPAKSIYRNSFDDYTGETNLENKTEIMDKNSLGHKKAVLSLHSRK